MTAPLMIDQTTCPKCGGMMWDNRTTKKNPKQPDYKCKNRSCDGVIWPPKNGSIPPTAAPVVEGKKPTMREAYKSITEWVLSVVGPIYEEQFGEGAFIPEVAAACVQTLFIQACKAGKVE